MIERLGLIVTSLLVSSLLQAAPVQTQLEESGWTELTTYERMMDYLSSLAKTSPRVKMESIGASVSGRSIPALFFTDDDSFASRRDEKPVVMIICQHHGNEPTGKEAALIVARRLLQEDSSLLDKLDLILVPQVNPDGSEAGERRNANDMDLNRNHVMLSEPESNAVHQLFLDWMPEVTLDVHETNVSSSNWMSVGYLKDPTEQFGGVSNLNIAPAVRALAADVIEPEVGRRIREAGVSYHEYVVGGPPETRRIRFSTTDRLINRLSMHTRKST